MLRLSHNRINTKEPGEERKQQQKKAHVDSETSRCTEEYSAKRYPRRRELAEVRKAVKITRRPSSKDKETPGQQVLGHRRRLFSSG